MGTFKSGITTGAARHRKLRIGIAQPLNLGDVLACFPMAGLLKRALPDAEIIFLAKAYAKPLIDACGHIDGFVDCEAVLEHPALLMDQAIDIMFNPFPCYRLAAAAFRARIPVRVGNLRRSRMLPYSNRFVMYDRRYSHLHEAQIVLKNLAALGLPTKYSLAELAPLMGITRIAPLCVELSSLLCGDRFNLILHPKSNGNGREWPIAHFLELARALPVERYRIFITGLAQEGEILRRDCPELFQLAHVRDVTGRMDLAQFISFMQASNGLVASGTGPLHIAAALGIHALGLFPPRRGMQPSRWQPIGVHAGYLAEPGQCRPSASTCLDQRESPACRCMMALTPARVLDRVLAFESFGSEITGNPKKPQPIFGSLPISTMNPVYRMPGTAQ